MQPESIPLYFGVPMRTDSFVRLTSTRRQRHCGSHFLTPSQVREGGASLHWQWRWRVSMAKELLNSRHQVIHLPVKLHDEIVVLQFCPLVWQTQSMSLLCCRCGGHQGQYKPKSRLLATRMNSHSMRHMV